MKSLEESDSSWNTSHSGRCPKDVEGWRITSWAIRNYQATNHSEKSVVEIYMIGKFEHLRGTEHI